MRDGARDLGNRDRMVRNSYYGGSGIGVS
jgi:hypothetical protein